MRKAREHKNSLRVNLGKFVYAQRRALDMTQMDLAKQTGLSQSLVARLEKEDVSVDKISFATLAQILKVTEKEILAVMCGLETFVQPSREMNCLPFVHAIAQNKIKFLSHADLITLLQIESELNKSKLVITKEMVPALLKQIRKTS